VIREVNSMMKTYVNLLAVKAEECNVQKAKVYTAMALEHDPSLIASGFSTKALLDREVLLVQSMECSLLVFSAHTDLAQILLDMKEDPGIAKAAFGSDGGSELSRAAWSLVCDAHCTHACLIASPSDIALACAVLAAHLVKVSLLLLPVSWCLACAQMSCVDIVQARHFLAMTCW
jgi:hypothetical protein